MKVLYLYPKANDLIRRHVTLLTDGLCQSVDLRTADTTTALRQALRDGLPDIIHCHGTGTYTQTRAVMRAVRKGARLIITPHGQLEPWTINQQSLTEKATKALHWQREFVGSAYAVILMGRLERTNFAKLGWNRRNEEIHNAVTTNTISPRQMCTSTFTIYQKVIDSNTLALMNEPTKRMLRALIKVGIMGDRRWSPPLPEGDIQWRQLLLYAEHEQIRNYVDYGINLLGLSVPSIDTKAIDAYFPVDFDKPRTIREVVGAYEGKETDYLMRIITQLHRQPLLLHMIEFTRELYRDSVNDDELLEALCDKRLDTFAAALMQVLCEQTALDEGYMPLPPTDNRQARQIRKLLTNHLKI